MMDYGFVLSGVLILTCLASIVGMEVTRRRAMVEGRPARKRLDKVAEKQLLEGSFQALEDDLVATATSAVWWRIGGSFTGIALLATFSLIGWVLSQKLGQTIGADQIDNTLLAEAVDQMGSKFFISAAGVGCSLLHGAIAHLLRRRLRTEVRDHLDSLRAQGSLMTTIEATQRQHQQIISLLQQQVTETEGSRRQAGQMADFLHDALTLQNKVLRDIESLHQQSWQRLLEGSRETQEAIRSIDASLQGGLAPLVDNVGKLAENLLSERAEELLQKLDRSFRAGLQAGLADVITPLQEMKQEIKGVSPEQALRDIAGKLQGALTGGASESTENFRVALEELGRSLPGMIAEMKAAATAAQQASSEAMAGFQRQLGEQSVKSREANDRLLDSLGVVLTRVEESSAEMQQVVSGIRTDTSTVSAALSSERETIERLLAEVRASAETVKATGHSAEQITLKAFAVVNELTDAAAGLRDAALAERESLRQSDDRVRRIREGREEFEAAMHRVSKAVADLLANDLAALRRQTDGAAAAMDDLLKTVDSTVIAGLASHVEEFTGAVTSLERTVQKLEGRAR
jgi:hypothetical protein